MSDNNTTPIKNEIDNDIQKTYKEVKPDGGGICYCIAIFLAIIGALLLYKCFAENDAYQICCGICSTLAISTSAILFAFGKLIKVNTAIFYKLSEVQHNKDNT